jgi:hypothetical protein
MRLFTIVALVLAGSASAADPDLPRLNGASDGVCAQALQIAQRIFRSEAVHLYEPPGIPSYSTSLMVLGPGGIDLSGGDALEADEGVFEKLPSPPSNGFLFWQREPRLARRLAVRSEPLGWRGDQYTLVEAPEAATPAEVLAAVESNSPSLKVFLGGGWRPPMILRDRNSGELWVILVGAPFDVLKEWNVLTQGEDGFATKCSVSFAPNGAAPMRLLPPELRILARLADQALGPGTDEGTLQPTARTRIEVEHAWANVALRPWALPQPYNTREEVEAGLAEWSLKARSFSSLRSRLQAQYPLAQAALARYYERHFGKDPEQARAAAAYSLDIAFRMYFVFHSADRGKHSRKTATTNPWGAH